MMNNFESKIVHNDSSISTRIFAKWITERYTFSLDKITLIQEELIDIIINDPRYKKVIKLNGEFENYLIINDDVMIIITQKIIEDNSENSQTFFELFAKDIDTFQDYYNEIVELNNNTNIDKLVVEYHVFSQSPYEGVSIETEYLKKELFMNVNSDVYESYLDIDMLYHQFLESKSPILQFTGKPGLGKSKLITLFVKYLLQNQKYLNNKKVLKIARPSSSEILANEQFWTKLRQGNYQALILDDIDYILTERNEQISSTEDKLHNDIVNKMLTFTDGLIHQKTKILITTNIQYKRVDKALSRDFRLFDSLELRALSIEEALVVWKSRFNLDENDFDNIFLDEDEITPARLSKEAEKFMKSDNKQEEKKASYCKEDGISKLSKIRNTNHGNIGFNLK